MHAGTLSTPASAGEHGCASRVRCAGIEFVGLLARPHPVAAMVVGVSSRESRWFSLDRSLFSSSRATRSTTLSLGSMPAKHSTDEMIAAPRQNTPAAALCPYIHRRIFRLLLACPPSISARTTPRWTS